MHRVATEEEREALVEVAREIALGVWVCVSVLGVVLGLVTASLAQVWTRDVLALGAVLGAVLVVASVCLMLVAAHRYLMRGAVLPRVGGPSRALAVGSVVTVGMLAWAVLAVIFATGWDFPASLFARAAVRAD